MSSSPCPPCLRGENVPGSPSTADHAVDLLLAQANLLRIRGRWDEAAERCTEALRLRPDSATAHSLLGDIYENRGRLEEAAQWYQMALDLHPESVADRAKLARVRELQAARSRSQGAGGRRAGGDGRSSLGGISWLRVATICGVAFCCTLLALAIVVSASDPRLLDGRSGTLSSPLIPRWRRPDPSQTTQERRLLAGMRPPLGPSLSLRASNVTMDPRGPIAVLTAVVEPGFYEEARSAGEDATIHLQREVYRLAALLIQREASLTHVQVRVLVPLTDSHDRRELDLAFVHTLPNAALRADATTLTLSDLRGLFRDAWWGATLR